MPTPNKHRKFVRHTDDPFNGGMPLPLLCEHQVTPTDRFFVRSHGSCPTLDPARYRLAVEGLVEQPLQLSLDQIKHEFEQVTLDATLVCAGNRRIELMQIEPMPGELPWGAEAIGNARWTGVRLRDLLAAAKLQPAAHHIAFTSLDQVERQGSTFGFGASITLEKALSGEVLLAYAMNGEPLTPEHGFPLRVVAPGYIGARSVKWLGTITAQDQPSTNYFQARAYRLFAPQVRPENVVWERGLMLSDIPVNAVICEPEQNATLPAGSISVRGYAITGAGRQIARVDLSTDGGTTWIQADLEGNPQPWIWQLWRAEVVLAPGKHQLIVRAVDSAANTQPAHLRDVWNFKGYMNNAWHRVGVHIRER